MIALYAILALLSCIGAVAQQCSGAGYDVSSAATQDLYIFDSGFHWHIRPCGSVSNTTCTSDPEALYGSMVCQIRPDGSAVYTVANWNQTVAQQATWLAQPTGPIVTVANGERCGANSNYWRTLSINFECLASATTPVLVSVREPEVCSYIATVRTASACQNVGPTMQNVVGSTFTSTVCGAGYYDLSSLSREDMYYNGVGHDYWIRMCNYVSSSNCSSVQPTSVCQVENDRFNGTARDMSDWNPALNNKYTITPSGLSVEVRSGDDCGGFGQRRATYNLMCNPNVTRPIVSYITEKTICKYDIYIQTPAVCTGTNAPSQGYCGGAGYDLTALQGLDLSVVSNGYTWWLHPCGVINVWETQACSGRNAMMCQQPTNNANGYLLASWDRTISTSATWMALSGGTGGVQLYIQTGESCGAQNRDTVIKFVCNETATGYPWFEKVEEPELCLYVAIVHTEHACDAVGSTADGSIGSTWESPLCGGGVYDLGMIRDEPADLVYDDNTTSSTSGYLYYVDLCGRVNNPACDSVQPTMVCQVDKSSGYAWSLSNRNDSTPSIYTRNNDGITMKSEGYRCGDAAWPRTVTIKIVCDGTEPAVLTAIGEEEYEMCHYAFVVYGRCHLGLTPPIGYYTSSSSSKLSGGAIAGIVIGSIVGALILLAILFFVCCGAASRGGSKKGHSFGHQDDEQSNVEGEVEMEDSTR